MTRRIQIALLVAALLLLLAGAFTRAGNVAGLAAIFRVLSTLRSPTPADLAEGIREIRTGEALGHVLVMLGLAVLVLAVSPLFRSKMAVLVSIALILVSGIASACLPSAHIAGALLLDRANLHLIYPECAAPHDDATHLFVLPGERGEWFVSEDDRGVDRALDPPGLEESLGRRLARRARPVTVFVGDACPAKRREEFLAAARAACDAASVTCKGARLPTEDELRAIWHGEAYAAREPYVNLTLAGTIAQLGTALAFVLLAAVAFRRGPGALVLGIALLAAAALLATPVPLYDAVGPGPAGSPDYRQAYEAIGLYRNLVLLSAAALVVGALACAKGIASTGDARSSGRPHED